MSGMSTSQTNRLPPEIVNLYISLLQEESSEVFACAERSPEFFIRVNTLKKPRSEIVKRLEEKGVKLSSLGWFQRRLQNTQTQRKPS
ncbi:MAG: hypothetical protein KIH01_04690 [Candidatus Freyarchaeota archaeon]|nr:hypothetical protein [Candidatus Jordarchaeia archaeon]